ncbi:MAG: hypothetical protein J0M34_01670 [Alphaproteobacteria bacterium]|nr:hypothetical protein [Alphaproteobacteria bacterium]
MTEPAPTTTESAAPSAIEAYVDALMAYNRAVYVNSPEVAATITNTADNPARDVANRQMFDALDGVLDNYTLPAGSADLTEVPPEFAGKLLVNPPMTELQALNNVIRARRDLVAAEAALETANPDSAETIISVLSANARERILNLEGAIVTPGDRIGTYDSANVERNHMVLAAERLHELSSETIPDADAIAILNGWITRAKLPANSVLSGQITEVLARLNLGSLDAFTVTSANLTDAIKLFQTVNSLTVTDGTRNNETVLRLRAERTNSEVAANQFTNNLLAGIQGFGPTSRGLIDSAGSAIAGLTGGSPPNPPANTPSQNNDILQGISEFFGGIWESITGMFSGEDGEGLNMGSIAGGGVIGALLFFVAGAFGPMGQFAQWPLAILGFFMGANMGRDWGRDGDSGSPSVSASSGGVPPRVDNAQIAAALAAPSIEALERARDARPDTPVTEGLEAPLPEGPTRLALVRSVTEIGNTVVQT